MKYLFINLFLIRHNKDNKFFQTSISKRQNIYFKLLVTLAFNTGKWHLMSYVTFLKVSNFISELLNIFKELTFYFENNCKCNDLTA